MLDAVTPFPEFTRLAEERIVGASLGNKICSALLLHLAGKTDVTELDKQTTFVWMAQTKFFARRSRPRAALGALRVKRDLNPKSVLIVGLVPVERGSQEGPSLGKGPVLAYPEEKKLNLWGEIKWIAFNKKIPLQEFPDFESSLMSPFLSEDTDVLTLGLPVLFPSTPAEIVDLKDVQALEKLLSHFLDEGVVK
jgi:putative aminopeptidase FrvX